MLRMLRHRIDRPSSRSFPVHSLYISDTQGRTWWEESSPSLCPVDHSAGILHSRLRLTAARECSCRYVSLSGSLAPPIKTSSNNRMINLRNKLLLLALPRRRPDHPVEIIATSVEVLVTSLGSAHSEVRHPRHHSNLSEEAPLAKHQAPVDHSSSLVARSTMFPQIQFREDQALC